jgi:hypothetical protein
MSHLEWFEAEGWITRDNVHEFMDSTIRGIFLPARHALFFYKGLGFYFDAGVVSEASRWAEELMSFLALDRHVEVYVGPPDALIHGTQYRQERSGSAQSHRSRKIADQHSPPEALRAPPTANVNWTRSRTGMSAVWHREALAAFQRRRAEVLVLLRSLSLAEWPRGGVHLSRGRLTLADWVARLAAHDDNHVAQLRRALEGRA